jgi:hypothetical protein
LLRSVTNGFCLLSQCELNRTKKGGGAPNIGSDNLDALDYSPEDRRADLGFPGEADSEECATRTEIVNRLFISSALNIGIYVLL